MNIKTRRVLAILTAGFIFGTMSMFPYAYGNIDISVSDILYSYVLTFLMILLSIGMGVGVIKLYKFYKNNNG